MSQVSEAYQNLASSLRTGMQGVGQAHISGAKMNLMEAQQEAELTDPVRILQKEKATMELQQKTIPYNISTVAGDDISAFENLIALPNKNDPNTSIIDIFPRQLGFTQMRTDEEGTVRYYKPGTNEFCNMLHMEANQEMFNKIIAANFNRFKHYRAKLENSTDEMEITDAKDFMSNPARQVRELAMDAEKLRNWGMEGAANGVYKLIGVIQRNMQLGISGREKPKSALEQSRIDYLVGKATPEQIKLLGKEEKEKGILEQARKAYIAGKATLAQKELLGKGEKKEKDNLKDLSTRYFQAIGRANSAKMGVGQFIPDENREEIANQEYERAKTILDQYKEAGGNLADLGIVEQPEMSLRDQAIEILKRNNKLVNEETITKVMDRIEKSK